MNTTYDLHLRLCVTGEGTNQHTKYQLVDDYGKVITEADTMVALIAYSPMACDVSLIDHNPQYHD